ncbi:MAG TPA: O-antigen ligase family protein [Vicinamibacterales bacterium]|nr:O-antigen ligase family protein [Vicinamibacterales bacterium]
MKDYAFVGVALLAVVAPFETTAPLVRLPGQSISDVEAALLVAFLVWGAGMVMWRALPEWRTPLTAPWVALLVVCGVASLFSQISRVNALHMTGRLGAAFGVYLLTANAVTTPHRLRRVLSLVLAIGVVVALLAWLEYLQWPRVLEVLRAFRPGLTTVGAQVRAGGSLQYPTIASMYLEIVFAFGVGLLLIALDAGERGPAAMTFVALIVIAEGITVTYTRAGLITMAATLVIAAGARLRLHGFDSGVRIVSALAVAVAALFVASRSTDSLWLRLTTEGQESWYRATIDAPSTIELATGRDELVPVSVTNTGRLVWDSEARPPIYFSYHWMSAAGDRVVAFDGVRTPFAAPVDPGQTTVFRARVRAPQQPGEYRLVWDLVQEGRLWFSTEPGASAQASRATIEGDPAAAPAPTFAPPKPTVRPGRLQLWRAAVAMFAAHPVFGVGPDNFRLSYGRYAGIATPDTRTHSNNMYLEVLAGTGIAGAFVLAWLAWAARGFVFANIGIACAIVAIAVHGMVDSFLSFAPTYILFAMTLGLAVVTHEDRV